MKIFSEPNLQNLLYYQAQTTKVKGYSPSAPILPLQALKGDSPSGLTPPAQVKIPKKLILTKDSFNNPYISSICFYLINFYNFEIYNLDKQKGLRAWTIHQINKEDVAEFDESEDAYRELLKKYQLARDKIVILQNTVLDELVTSLKFNPLSNINFPHHGFLTLGAKTEATPYFNALNQLHNGALEKSDFYKKNSNQATTTITSEQPSVANDIFTAVKNGDLGKVKEYFDKDSNTINASDELGMTPLYIAADKGHLDIVEFLIKIGNAAVDKARTDGTTPLYIAAQQGHLEVVEFLIETGKAEVDKARKSGATPLYIAADKGHLDIVKFLIKIGNAAVDKALHDGTPILYGAAQNGHLETVKFLSKIPKVKVDKTRDNGATPLFAAAAIAGDPEVVNFLITEAKANVNIVVCGTPLLNWVCIQGKMDITRFCLEFGLNFNENPANLPRNKLSPANQLIFDLQVKVAEKKKNNPLWKAIEDAEIWPEMLKYPGELAHEATRDLRVAHFILQNNTLANNIEIKAWKRIFNSHPELNNMLTQNFLIWSNAQQNFSDKNYKDITHLDIIPNALPSNFSTLVFPNLISIQILTAEADINFFGELIKLKAQAPNLQEIIIPRALQHIITPDLIKNIGVQKISVQEDLYLPVSAHLPISHNLSTDHNKPGAHNSPVRQSLPVDYNSPVSAHLPISHNLPTGNNFPVRYNLPVSQQRAGFSHKGREDNYLYVRRKQSWNTPNTLSAPDNPHKEILKREALFKVSGNITPELAEHLRGLQEMAPAVSYKLQEDNNTFEEIQISKSLTDIKIQNISSEFVELSLIDFSLLKKTIENFYVFPVLSDDQQLIECTNGTMFADSLTGVWLFKPKTTLENCRIKIAVPKTNQNEYFDVSNINDAEFNNIPSIAIIRAYFLGRNKFANSGFNKDNQTDTRCADRVRHIFQHYPKIKSDWVYAGNDCHAFLMHLSKDGERIKRIKVDLGGGGINGYEYLPVPNQEIDSPTNITPSNPKRCYYPLNSTNTTALAIECIKEVQMQGAEPYYINDFNQFDIQTPTLKIQNNGLTITDYGLFADFINEAYANKQKKYTLIIDLSSFSANELLRINTIFDEKPRIQGQNLPDNISIITLSKNKPDDSSFLRRFSSVEGRIPSLNTSPLATANTINIDLCALPDWESSLFGDIVFHEANVVWQRSALMEQLCTSPDTSAKTNNLKIVLNNFPQGTEEEISRRFVIANALGYWDYHGFRIPFTNVAFEFGTNSFDFKEVVKDRLITWYKNVLANNDFTQEAIIINTHLFDHLITQKKIIDGKYLTIPGVLKEQNTVRLYITSNLSDNQWYILFYAAKHNNVNLILATAPGVTIPEQTTNLLSPKTLELEHNKDKKPQIFIMPNPNDFCKKNNLANNENTLLLNIEDFSYQDLFYNEEYDTKPHFNNFRIRESDLLQKLLNPRLNIIIKGEFSAEMLAYLHPLFVKNKILINGEERPILAQLTFLIESETPSIQESLKFLPNVTYDNTSPQKTNNFSTILTEAEANISELNDLSPQAAKSFLDNRKQLLLDVLNNNSWCQLVGETGVGKTQLMQALQAEFPVYFELDSLDLWANDNSASLKILFIDESNIENMHFTFLSGFTDEKQKHILYKGKIYTLTDKHKIVFARNPNEYGGGRVKQKLFAMHDIPVLELKDFSPAYIYQNMLLPIFQAFALQDEATFKKDCEVYLKHYLAKNPNFTSVRDLQQHVLLYCFNQKNKTSIHKFWHNPQNDMKVKRDTYIDKNVESNLSNKIDRGSRANAQYNLRAFLLLYKSQQKNSQNILPNLGLNGFLLTGKPGVGKSTMVEELVYQANLSDKLVKLDISLQQEQLIEQLILHMSEGKLVWIDEIDALVESGLEKVLNALLLGLHPYTHQPLPNCGRILATGNGAAYSGRGQISKALQNRFISVELEDGLALKNKKSNDNIDAVDLPAQTESPISSIEFSESSTNLLPSSDLTPILQDSENYKEKKETLQRLLKGPGLNPELRKIGQNILKNTLKLENKAPLSELSEILSITANALNPRYSRPLDTSRDCIGMINKINHSSHFPKKYKNKTILGLFAFAGALLISASIAFSIVTYGASIPLSIIGIKIGLYLIAGTGALGLSGLIGLGVFAKSKNPVEEIKEDLYTIQNSSRDLPCQENPRA